MGGGLAGLIALKNIVKEGKKVELYESGNLVGGSLCPDMVNGVSVDKGMSWKGDPRHPLCELLKEYNI